MSQVAPVSRLRPSASFPPLSRAPLATSTALEAWGERGAGALWPVGEAGGWPARASAQRPRLPKLSTA